MLRLKRIFTLVLFTLAVALEVNAQDPEFTQFYAAPLYLNPAFAGSTKCPRVNLNYRDQWPALRGTFITTMASFDQYVDRLQGGLGLIILNDKAGQGTLNTTTISGIYSYQLNISRNVAAKIGFEASYFQKKYDWEGLKFGDNIDPRYGFVLSSNEQLQSNTKSYADFSSGLIIYSSYVYGGFAVHHLTEPDEQFLSATKQARLPRKITVHAGAILPLGKDKKNSTMYLSPGFLYRQQQDFNQFNFGAYLGRGPFVIGLWSRTTVAKEKIHSGDSFIILLGVQQGIFKFGYSYDVTVSKLYNASAGSHELSLGMQFDCRPKKKKFRAIRCPSF